MTEDEPTTGNATLVRIDRFAYGFFILLATVCAALAVWHGVQHEFLLAFVYVTQAAVWACFMVIRNSWLRLGFRRGQWAAITHAQEARSRGMTGDDWIISEMERATGVTSISINTDELP